MSIDLSALRAMQQRRDASLGIEERFLQPVIGGKPTVAVLAEPLGQPSDVGWVVCHSLGLEQIWFYDLEVATARALAGAGQPVLRFHGQGYGDSAGDAADVRVATHLRDAREAVDVLRSTTAVTRIGLIGARFGGAVALVVGTEVGAARVVMWDPMVDGPTYARSLSRTAAITMLTTAGDVKAAELDALDEQDELDVSGAPLSKTLLDDVAAFAPIERLAEGTIGAAMVVQVSKGQEARPATDRLVQELRRHGCDAALDVVADTGSRTWGNQRYRSTESSRTKSDTQATLVPELVRRTERWATRGPMGGAP